MRFSHTTTPTERHQVTEEDVLIAAFDRVIVQPSIIVDGKIKTITLRARPNSVAYYRVEFMGELIVSTYDLGVAVHTYNNIDELKGS